MEPEIEKHIIDCVLNGDTGKYEYFLRAYSTQMFNLLFRLSGNKEDAEELTQDVFLKAYCKLRTFHGKSSFSTWLYAIAYHVGISYARKRDFNTCVMDERELSLLSDTVVDEALDDESEERIHLLQKAVSRLEPEERLIIALFYKEGKDVQEVARIVNVSPGALKVRLHRIRKKIYLLMKKEEAQLWK